MPSPLVKTKAELRQEMKPIMATINGGVASNQMNSLLRERFKGFQGVLGTFWPFPNEFNLIPFMLKLSQTGAQVVLPWVEDGQHLLFRQWIHQTPMVDGILKTKAPAQEIYQLPKVVLVPGLVFDAHKNRLGRGGGFYDRTIQTYRQRNSQTQFIGLCHRRQLIHRLPTDVWDQPLDDLITLG